MGRCTGQMVQITKVTGSRVNNMGKVLCSYQMALYWKVISSITSTKANALL